MKKRIRKKSTIMNNAVKSKKYRNTINSKSWVLMIVFSVSFFFIVFNLVRIVFINDRNYEQAVKEKQVDNNVKYSKYLEAKRGTITDRNGVVLAYSEKNFKLTIDPYNLNQKDEEDRNRTLEYITSHFKITRSELDKILKEESDLKYKVILKDLTATELGASLEQIEAGRIDPEKADSPKIGSVYLESYYKRIYKQGVFASSLLGWTNNDGGQYGLENYYDEYLAGTPGREFGVLNDGYYAKNEVIEPIDGGTLVLTIDYNLQKYAEDTMKAFLETNEYGCDGFDVVLMDPTNSEILAMASYPTFDPNKPNELDEKWLEKINDFDELDVATSRYKIWKNHMLSDGYEPGSTFKPFTMAAALELEAIDLNTKFYCDGGYTVGDRYIRCSKPEGHGEQNYIEALKNSCNPALMQIAERIDNQELLDYYYNFGFGTKTGIDLIGETSGNFFTSENFDVTEKATTSFGQGFLLTQIQLINSFSGLINGGDLKKPSVALKILDPNQGLIYTNKDITVRQIVSPDTSEKLRYAMEEVVLDGTAKKAQVEGYTIGGKTGTAQKIPRDPDGEMIISFIGFSPVDHPKIVGLVSIDNFYYIPGASSSVSAKIFSDIMVKAVPYFDTQKK